MSEAPQEMSQEDLQAVEKIKDGTITEYVYDPGSAALKRRG